MSEGTHTVRMEARLAGAEVVFSTEEISVELRCSTLPTQDVESALEEGCSAAPVGPSSRGPGVAALALVGLAFGAAARTRRRP